MSPPLVWFNKYLGNTWEVIAFLRRARRAREFRILCTHTEERYPGRHSADLFEKEPAKLSDKAYVDYCLDVARRHQVTLFLPGHKRMPIARAAERFAELGTRVLTAADAATLALLNNKARLYAELAGSDVPLPDYEVVNDLKGFDAAWKRLRPRHELLCYKPAVSVFGLGFHIVADREPAVALLKADEPNYASLEDTRRSLKRKGRFRDLLLMEHLPGHERSVDCLGRDGELIRCVVRRKEEDRQVLEDNPTLVEVVRGLTARFRLSNLFNVQFRDSGDETFLLEINARMSGGLPFAFRSGLLLPLWAIRLALGTAIQDEVPQPRAGLWVPKPEMVTSR